MIPPGRADGAAGGSPPRDPTADECVELGLHHFDRDQLAEARLWWTRALALEPGHARAEACLRSLASPVAEQAELARPSGDSSAPRPAPWSSATPSWLAAAMPSPPWATSGATHAHALAPSAPPLGPTRSGRTPVGPAWAPPGAPLPRVTAASPSGAQGPASPWAAPGTPAPWATQPGMLVPHAPALQGSALQPGTNPPVPSQAAAPSAARAWPPTGWSSPPPAPSPSGASPWASTTPGGSALDVWSRPGRGGAPTTEPRAAPSHVGMLDAPGAGEAAEGLPPPRTFALGPDSASGVEPSPEELIDPAWGLELVVEEPEDLHPDAFGLDAFAADGPSGELQSAIAQTPWDLGPSETSIVTLDDSSDTAVAELTPLPSVEPLELSSLSSFGAAALGASPTALAGRSEPTAAPSPRSVLAKAEDRMALHDFSGALELLERVPGFAAEAEDALALSLRARHRLEQQYLGKLGALDRVPVPLLPDGELIWLNLDQRAAYLLSRVDGVATFDDLVALSGMPKLEALRILSELVRDGVIG